MQLPSHTTMTMVYVQNNRLSCAIEADGTTVKDNLFLPGSLPLAVSTPFTLPLPGNDFDAEGLPSWVLMRDVTFLAIDNFATTWSASIAEAMLAVLLGAVLMYKLNNGWPSFTTAGMEAGLRAQYLLGLQTALFLVAGSLLFWPVLVAVYWTSAGYVQCGSAWKYLTALYLYENLGAMWGVAVLAILFAGFVAMGLKLLEAMVFEDFLVQTAESSGLPLSASALHSRVAFFLLWIPVTVALSIPSSLHVISQSVPADNTMFPGFTLELFGYSAAAFNSISSSVLVPLLADYVARLTGCNERVAVLALVPTLLVFTVLAPLATSFFMDQDCYSNWTTIWGPCQPPNSFDIKATVTVTHVVPSMPQLEGSMPMSIITHEDICVDRGGTIFDDSCARTAVGDTGKLLIQSMVFTAFVGPVVELLMYGWYISKHRERFLASWEPSRVSCMVCLQASSCKTNPDENTVHSPDGNDDDGGSVTSLEGSGRGTGGSAAQHASTHSREQGTEERSHSQHRIHGHHHRHHGHHEHHKHRKHHTHHKHQGDHHKHRGHYHERQQDGPTGPAAPALSGTPTNGNSSDDDNGRTNSNGGGEDNKHLAMYEAKDNPFILRADRAFTSVVAQLDIPIMLGVIIPTMLPLAAVSILGTTLCKQFCRTRLHVKVVYSEHRPTFNSAWISLLIGWVLLSWLMFTMVAGHTNKGSEALARETVAAESACWFVLLGWPLSMLSACLVFPSVKPALMQVALNYGIQQVDDSGSSPATPCNVASGGNAEPAVCLDELSTAATQTSASTHDAMIPPSADSVVVAVLRL